MLLFHVIAHTFSYIMIFIYFQYRGIISSRYYSNNDRYLYSAFLCNLYLNELHNSVSPVYRVFTKLLHCNRILIIKINAIRHKEMNVTTFEPMKHAIRSYQVYDACHVF